MKQFSVYLCGPINGCTDEECNNWRDFLMNSETKYPINWINPMVRDYRGREMEPGIDAEIVENDKLDIDGSDLLIVNYDKPSVGTSMEILYAWDLGIPVWLVRKPGTKLSPWLTYHSSGQFDSFDDVLKALNALF